MAKKKRKKKVTRSRCSECGGPGRGRSAHKKTCPKYKGGKSAKLGIEGIQNWDVERLIDLRSELDKLIKRKAPDLKKKIASLQKTLKSIQK